MDPSGPKIIFRFFHISALLLILCASAALADLKTGLDCVRKEGIAVYDDSTPQALKDATRRVNTLNTTLPLAVVMATSETQVQSAVKCLASAGVKIVPQGGRSSYQGASVLTDAVSLDVSGLNSISYSGNIVKVGAGTRFKKLYTELSQRNDDLTVLGGLGLSVSVAGFVLTGGISPFSRRFGLGCDKVQSITLVDYRGELITATPTEESDLFWALCGGGAGNFGVVVRLEIAMVEIPTVTYYFFEVPSKEARQFMSFWQDTVAVQAGPDIFLKAVPYDSYVDVYGMYPGSETAARAAIEAAGLGAGTGFTKQYEQYKEMSWSEGLFAFSVPDFNTSGTANNEPESTEFTNIATRSVVIETMSEAALDAIMEWVAANSADEVYSEFQIWNSDSAIADAPASAFAYRKARQLAMYGLTWSDSSKNNDKIAILRDLENKLASSIDKSKIYMGFTCEIASPKQLYGDNLVRLNQVKGRVDPNNVFSGVSGIEPDPNFAPKDTTTPAGGGGGGTTPSSPASDATDSSSSGGDSGSSMGVIIGAAVGGIAVAAIAGVAAYLFVVKRKKKATESDATAVLEAGGGPNGAALTPAAAAPIGSKTVPPTRPEMTIGSAAWQTQLQPTPSTAPPSTLGSGLASDSIKSSTDLSNDPLLTWISSLPPESSRSSGKSSSISDAAAMEPWLFQFAELTIVKPLGEGSFGKVYLAKWRGTPVAVKMLVSTSGVSSTEAAAMTLTNPDLNNLRSEAGLMVGVRHPNCIQFLGLCTYPPCVATEFCQKGSLYGVLSHAATDPVAAKELTWGRRLRIALDAARGILYLHARTPPIVHRDVKSPNILIAADWTAKIADFNLSKLAEDVLASKAASTAGGALNPRWLCPETMQGERSGTAGDVYGFGVILWEMLTWQLPWIGVNEWVIVRQIQQGTRPELPPVAELPGMPPGGTAPPGFDAYVELMQRCWDQEPDKRPTMAEVVAALEAIMTAAGIREAAFQ